MIPALGVVGCDYSSLKVTLLLFFDSFPVILPVHEVFDVAIPASIIAAFVVGKPFQPRFSRCLTIGIAEPNAHVADFLPAAKEAYILAGLQADARLRDFAERRAVLETLPYVLADPIGEWTAGDCCKVVL